MYPETKVGAHVPKGCVNLKWVMKVPMMDLIWHIFRNSRLSCLFYSGDSKVPNMEQHHSLVLFVAWL